MCVLWQILKFCLLIKSQRRFVATDVGWFSHILGYNLPLWKFNHNRYTMVNDRDVMPISQWNSEWSIPPCGTIPGGQFCSNALRHEIPEWACMMIMMIMKTKTMMMTLRMMLHKILSGKCPVAWDSRSFIGRKWEPHDLLETLSHRGANVIKLPWTYFSEPWGHRCNAIFQ